jgi:hypothetical protein
MSSGIGAEDHQLSHALFLLALTYRKALSTMILKATIAKTMATPPQGRLAHNTSTFCVVSLLCLQQVM